MSMVTKKFRVRRYLRLKMKESDGLIHLNLSNMNPKQMEMCIKISFDYTIKQSVEKRGLTNGKK